MSVGSEVETSSRASNLRGLFAEWLRLFEVASETFPQTKEWWFIEKTLVSLLSTATWNLGYASIVEPKTTRAPSSSGHADLLAALPEGKLIVEAKIMWFSNPGGFDTVLGYLEDAQAQVRSLPVELSQQRLALAFGVLERGDQELPGLLLSSIQRARELNADVIAWHLPSSAPPGVRYPGCLAVGTLES